jgi:hypothetical protein
MKNGLIEARFLFAPSGFARCEAVLFEFMRWSSRHSERLRRRRRAHESVAWLLATTPLIESG